jgi:hypothetical protein
MTNRKAWPWIAAVLAACASPPPVDRAQWEMAEQRLLQPLLTDAYVGCSELLIEISPNFHANVGQPAVDPNLHSLRKEHVDGWDETVWVNKVGDSGAFTLTIGETDQITDQGIVRGRSTRFTVLHQVRLRVHAAREVAVQLDVTAKGKPLIRGEGGRVQDLDEFRVSDGILVAR